MAFKFLILSAILAVVNAGAIFTPVTQFAKIANPAVDAVASTHQNVVRSFGGTVSTYSKAIDTPYSSVRKVDSRITNNVYTPAVAKTLTYAAPTVSYAGPAVIKPVSYAAPAITYTAPALAKTVSYAAKPVIAYSPAVAVAHVAVDAFGTHWGY